MRSFRFIDQKAGRIVASLGLLLATILPTLTPALASAAQITSRSVELSNSTASATGVTYQIDFTSVGAAEAVLIDFCSNTPLIGEACTAPTGLDVTSVAESDADITSVVDEDANTLFIEGSVAATTAKSFEVTTITNPSTAGPMYARIITYATSLANAQSQYTDAENLGTYVDTGSVAVSVTSGIGVTGDVLETMTFCVSGANTVTAGCASGITAPTLEIGETSGSVVALSASAVSTSSVYTQLSTNALGGAIVSLKSNTTGCGGLSRLGAADFATGCGIAAAGTTLTVDAGEAQIGVRGSTATDEGTATGAFVTTGSYDTTNYRLNYVNGDASGVTGPYGDPFLTSSGAPVSNKEMQLTFGASISPTTPAGRYTANYSLIATGTF